MHTSSPAFIGYAEEVSSEVSGYSPIIAAAQPTFIPNHQLNFKSPKLIIIILGDNHNETVNHLTRINYHQSDCGDRLYMPVVDFSRTVSSRATLREED